MILVVIVGMGLVFAFVSVYTANYQAGIGSSVLESLTIEDIWLHGSAGTGYNNQVTLWVYNSGQIDSVIHGIYINGIAASNGTSFNFNVPVAVGQHVSITLQWSSAWVSGMTYDFKVSTLRGSSFEQSIMATY